MFKKLLVCAMVAALSAACASAPTPRTAAATASNTMTARNDCIDRTASRIPVKPGECSPSAGRTYTHDDLERTGQTDAAHALQMLDPSITVNR